MLLQHENRDGLMEVTGEQSFKMESMLICTRCLDMGKMGRGIAMFHLGAVAP